MTTNLTSSNLPCPFCGHEVDLEDDDTLYPSGLYWREIDGSEGLVDFISFKDRLPTDNPMYSMNCPEVAGGCGAEIIGMSKEDALRKWNTRTAPKASGPESSLTYRLLKRAEIRRNITTRKSVQEGAPDRIADLLEEAAAEITRLNTISQNSGNES